jgi:hypothetical protein
MTPASSLPVDKGLSCVLKHAMTSNEIERIKIANTAPNVNHLLFADGCITSDATKMNEIHDMYCLASDQIVNNERPTLFFGKGCNVAVSGSIKNILEMPNDSLNDKYLGLSSDMGRYALAIDK